MRRATCACFTLSTMRTPAAAEEVRGAPLLPRVKPWKKARHVGSTESGLSSHRWYICSMTSELARVGREREFIADEETENWPMRRGGTATGGCLATAFLTGFEV